MMHSSANNKQLFWGIIGCGDVTEVKSGPAFNKVPNSRLQAVMRRDASRAEDYARRHGVPSWYSDAGQLIADPAVNAIYIATPPDSHEEYLIQAAKAAKPVYVEKPMALNAESARRMQRVAEKYGIALSVAHYRREQPLFRKIREWLTQGVLGEIRLVDLVYQSPLFTEEELQKPRVRWRVDPAVSGGGIFHDLAPHQLDLMCYFFGKPVEAAGMSANQARQSAADDLVTGLIRFEKDILFNGRWCFNAAEGEKQDRCTIYGSKGSLHFSVFGEPVLELVTGAEEQRISFPKLEHVQQPMIAAVTDYFLGRGPNPCPAEGGVQVMELIDRFTEKPVGG